MAAADRTKAIAIGAALLAVAALLLTLPVATSAERGSVEVRNGVYGKLRGDSYVYFKVRDRRVSKLSFNMRVECVDSRTGDRYDRYFTGKNIGGGRVGDDGRWSGDFTVVSDFRTGAVNAEINFRRARPLASFAVIVSPRNGSSESCDGFLALRAKRGPEPR